MVYDHAQLNCIALIPTLPNFKIWNIRVSNINTVRVEEGLSENFELRIKQIVIRLFMDVSQKKEAKLVK